jgi:hypothetical protein
MTGIWNISSDQPLIPNSTVTIGLRNGSTTTEKVGAYLKTDYYNGDLRYYYKVNRGASKVQQKVQGAQNKWQRKTPNINIQDLF